MNSKIAILYDFDRTLITKDMQEYSFIPSVGMDAQTFWKQVDDLATQCNMDRILAYMYYMLKQAVKNNQPITRESFEKLGANIELYPGVDSWFQRINDFGKQHGVEVEHFVISSGIKEMIQGTSISEEFKKIFACEYHYDEQGCADWPNMVVNYTNKTQFLFRINKGVLDVCDDAALNEYVPKDERDIPFRNMIYVGDGMTDVPCMKLVRENGGHSIAVYNDRKTVAEKLLKDERVDFITKADYQAGSEIEKIVQTIIKKDVEVAKLDQVHQQQLDEVNHGV